MHTHPLVYITHPIPTVGVELLRKRYRVVMRQGDVALSNRSLKVALKNVDALLCDLVDRIDAEVMDAAPRLRVIANYAVGVDNIDIAAATQRGIVVTNTPGVLDDAVAELTIGLMLAVTRRIVEADRFVRAEKFKSWMPQGFLGPTLFGKTLGIVGAGRIGTTVARVACNGFGMKVVYTDVKRSAAFERATKATHVTLSRLLATADVVSLHVPLLPSTRHLISTAQLRRMKRSAILINTARGPVVDERALVQALHHQRIAGAGLDVFECEPSIDCDVTDGPSLAAFDRVVLTPHIASGTIEARDAMARIAAQAIVDVLHNRRPATLVNTDVWSHR